MNKLSLLLESLDSVPYEFNMTKPQPGRLSFVFEDESAVQYRVWIEFDSYKLSTGKGKVKTIKIGQNVGGTKFKSLTQSPANIMRVFATMGAIIRQFVETPSGKKTDGFTVVYPKKFGPKASRLTKLIIKKVLKGKFTPIDINFLPDEKGIFTYAIRKGTKASEVFDTIPEGLANDEVVAAVVTEPEEEWKTFNFVNDTGAFNFYERVDDMGYGIKAVDEVTIDVKWTGLIESSKTKILSFFDMYNVMDTDYEEDDDYEEETKPNKYADQGGLVSDTWWSELTDLVHMKYGKYTPLSAFESDKVVWFYTSDSQQLMLKIRRITDAIDVMGLDLIVVDTVEDIHLFEPQALLTKIIELIDIHKGIEKTAKVEWVKDFTSTIHGLSNTIKSDKNTDQLYRYKYDIEGVSYILEFTPSNMTTTINQGGKVLHYMEHNMIQDPGSSVLEITMWIKKHAKQNKPESNVWFDELFSLFEADNSFAVDFKSNSGFALNHHPSNLSIRVSQTPPKYTITDDNLNVIGELSFQKTANLDGVVKYAIQTIRKYMKDAPSKTGSWKEKLESLIGLGTYGIEGIEFGRFLYSNPEGDIFKCMMNYTLGTAYGYNMVDDTINKKWDDITKIKPTKFLYKFVDWANDIKPEAPKSIDEMPQAQQLYMSFPKGTTVDPMIIKAFAKIPELPIFMANNPPTISSLKGTVNTSFAAGFEDDRYKDIVVKIGEEEVKFSGSFDEFKQKMSGMLKTHDKYQVQSALDNAIYKMKFADGDAMMKFRADGEEALTTKGSVNVVKSYTGSASVFNNVFIGKQSLSGSASTSFEEIKKLDKAFRNHGLRFPDDMVLYRGQHISTQVIENLANGKSFVFASFVSTSVTPKVGIKFVNLGSEDLIGGSDTNGSEGVARVLFVFRNVSKTLALSPLNSKYSDELEVVLNRGTIVQLDTSQNQPIYKRQDAYIIHVKVQDTGENFLNEGAFDRIPVVTDDSDNLIDLLFTAAESGVDVSPKLNPDFDATYEEDEYEEDE